MKSIRELTLDDFMQHELYMWSEPNEKFGYNIYVENMVGDLVAEEMGAHPDQVENLAETCHRFCMFHESLMTKHRKTTGK